MSGWGGCRRWLQEDVRRVAGVAVADGLLLLAGLARVGEAWEVTCLESVLLAPSGEGWAQGVAEKTAALLARLGWEDVPVVLVLPPERTVEEEMQLPALSAEEIAQTAHWEMTARDPFGGALFLTAYEAVGAGVYRVAAVSKGEADGARRAFEAAGVRLWAIASVPAGFHLLAEGAALRWGDAALPLSSGMLAEDGAFHAWDEHFSAALYGAALLVQAVPETGCVFPFGEVRLRRLCVRRLAGIAAAFVFAGLLVATGVDAGRLYLARQDLQREQAELALLRGDRSRMEDFREAEAWIAQRDDCLRALSAKNPPAAAVLSLLGTRNVPGVRLTALHLEPHEHLEILGEAVTFDALADYLGGFEQQEGALSGEASLTHSTRREDGSIEFSLSLALPEQIEADAETAAAGAEAGEEEGARDASME